MTSGIDGLEPVSAGNCAFGVLDEAFEKLDQGDLRQASENGWGAAAQMVKAVAEERGWPQDDHSN